MDFYGPLLKIGARLPSAVMLRPRKLPVTLTGLRAKCLRPVSTLPGSTAAARKAKLMEVYKPFNKLVKDSAEWNELARSGRVWEDYFKPWDSERLGYLSLQKENSSLLDEIDRYRDAMNVPVPELAKTLVSEYAHQSVTLEGSRLKAGDSFLIASALERDVFKDVDMTSTTVQDLLSLSIPDFGFTKYDSTEVMELTNHIFASYWVAETAASRRGSAGLNEIEIRQLSALVNRGTASEDLYTKGWGKRISLGDYRSAPIGVRSNRLRIFPYPAEVPSIMKRFLQWRDQNHESKRLHPLILACQEVCYFLNIHPFPDGNGRVGRIIMHDYMVRQGYMPVLMQGLERVDYLRMINDASDGKPEEFVTEVLVNQLDALRTFKSR